MYEYLAGSVLEVKEINQDMFLWIYENKQTIEECVQAVPINSLIDFQ